MTKKFFSLIICICLILTAGCGRVSDEKSQEELADYMSMIISCPNDNVLELSPEKIRVENNDYYVYGDYGSDIYLLARLESNTTIEYSIFYNNECIHRTVLRVNGKASLEIGYNDIYYVDVNLDGCKDIIIAELDGSAGEAWSYYYAYDLKNEKTIHIAKCGEGFGGYTRFTAEQVDQILAFKDKGSRHKEYSDMLFSLEFSKLPLQIFVDGDGFVYFRQYSHINNLQVITFVVKTKYNKDEDTFDVVDITAEYKNSEQTEYFRLEN